MSGGYWPTPLPIPKNIPNTLKPHTYRNICSKVSPLPDPCALAGGYKPHYCDKQNTNKGLPPKILNVIPLEFNRLETTTRLLNNICPDMF